MATLKSYKETEFEKLLYPVRINTLSYEIMAKLYQGSKLISIGEVTNFRNGQVYITKCYPLNKAFLSSQDAYKAKSMITSNKIYKYRAKFIVVTKGRMDKVIRRNANHVDQPTRR